MQSKPVLAWGPEWPMPRLAWLTKTGEWVGEVTAPFRVQPTHWQPLPEPPA